MRSIAHIVNPVVVNETSDLFAAQPVTFETMKIARAYAADRVAVGLYTAQYPEDRPVVPSGFEATPDLDRSVLDIATFHKQRKLPLISDILQRLYDASDAEYFVYTNIDIALQPHFYAAVDTFLDKGYDALIINRRTIHPRHASVRDVSLLYGEVGKPHPGSNCFVFRRDAYPTYKLDAVGLAASAIGMAMMVNLGYQASKLKLVRNKHLTFHIGNDQAWRTSDYDDYRDFSRRALETIVDELEDEYGPLDEHERLASAMMTVLPGPKLLERSRERRKTRTR